MCAKKGGFFKCCVSVWNLNAFEIARNKLMKEGLIKGNETKTCKPRAKKDPCVVCKAEGVCTMRDIGTGEIKHIYQQKYKREHKVEEIYYLDEADIPGWWSRSNIQEPCWSQI